MRFVPYWARESVGADGQPDPAGVAVAFGWSADSQEAARAHAIGRARRIAERLRELKADELRPSRQYYCDDGQPMREPIVEEIVHDRTRVAVVTRNSYGCFVLNTENAMFIDIDLPPLQQTVKPGLIARMMGARTEAPAAREAREAPIRSRVAAVMARHPELGLRLYRTHGGFRGLITSECRDPMSDEAHGLMEALGSDPLYRHLCRVQGCFRARITAKPWRLGVSAAPWGFFPWADDPERKRGFDTWDDIYTEVRRDAKVCEEVTHYGPSTVHPTVRPVMEHHDRWTRGAGSLV